MEPGYDVRRSKIKTWDDVVYHPEKIINDFPIFKNQKSLIYFDNASTTHKPISVIINPLSPCFIYAGQHIMWKAR